MLNQTICLGSGSNTGFGDCPFDMKNIIAFILTPAGFTISAENLATKELTRTALQAATLAVAKSRIYPVNNIAALDGDIEDAVTETLGYGDIVTLRDGNYNLNFRFLKGALCLSNALRKFNNSYPDILLIDANGVLVGQRVGDTLKSIPLVNFYQKGQSLNDGAGKVAGYVSNIVFKPNYINEDIGFIDGESSAFWNLSGLQDVILSETTGSATPILKIAASTGCSGESIISDFATELADVDNWIFKNGSTGAVITITSVTISGEVATVTLDDEDTDYPAGAGTITGQWAAPSVLSGNGIDGFESNIITIATT